MMAKNKTGETNDDLDNIHSKCLLTPNVTGVNDSGYFTPSPAQTSKGDISPLDSEVAGTSSHNSKQDQTKLTTKRKNLYLKFQTDRLRAIQEHTESNPELSNSNCTDIIHKLGDRGMWGISSQILRRLDGRDLSGFCCVCKYWKETCLNDALANQRRKRYLQQIRLNRENNRQHLKSPIKAELSRQPLNAVGDSNLKVESDPTKNIPKSKAELNEQRFRDVIASLEPHERLDKCPKCCSPARVNKNTNFTRCSFSGCTYEYCILCRCPYTPPHRCSPVKCRIYAKSVNCRSSKRSLRRLLL